MILIADSGASKTDWGCVSRESDVRIRFSSQGYNPNYITGPQIVEDILANMPVELDPVNVKEIYFYGAGVTPLQYPFMEETLRKVFTKVEHVFIAMDTLASCRALLGRNPGFSAILGTGANTCLYDGCNEGLNIDSCGFILGDEGSSAVLGRRLVGDCLKNQLPEALREEFLSEYKLTQEIILEKVYRQPLANRFLASLTPFLSKHREVPEVHRLLVESFVDFFVRNVKQYRRPWLRIHCIGSIANAFSNEVKEAAESLGMELGIIQQSPMEGLIKYHYTSQEKA